ncbi:PaaI family thioesterase [Sphingomonas sp.]|jgi:acyl-coenzyme A thioesterase PaaI-like protein|uniref:PaaI family thioesterase n=1 Tax=Sphingomonas sp. TaxID=28214 RepID=UPI00262971CF|nr:PaaI family thioesterase [Sphingomonas sp.]MDF2496220.1 phenylacetic acid degradation protein [Sphingomonas sp.]
MKLPPYADLLGATLEWENGLPILAMPFGPAVIGRPGFVQGGAITGLIEMAALAALRHQMASESGSDANRRVKPINVTIDFMRGGRERLTYAAGTVTRLGNRIANVEAIAWQESRAKPIASARMNYLIARG